MSFDPNLRASTYGAGTASQAALDEGLRKHMLAIYNYMGTGLALSAFVALAINLFPAINGIFYSTGQTAAGDLVRQPNMLFFVASFAPLGMLLIAMFMRNMSAGATQAFFWAFTALQGVSFSLWLEVYAGGDVVLAFFVTSVSFLGLSLYGYTTKQNLSAMGSFLIMGVIGLLVLSLVNIFVASTLLMNIIAAAGILIFAGLIAYDTQRLKDEYIGGVGQAGADVRTSHAVWGALSLYINFINLMQFILYFLGNRE